MYLILSLFIICAAFAYGIETSRDENTRKVLIAVCLLFLTLVSGTRLIGGLDYGTYEGHYRTLPIFPYVLEPYLRNNNYEIGYTYFASFFKTLGISFYGFCVIEATIFYTCLWYGMRRYTRHFGIVILVFLYKLFFYDTMISMRQSLTIAMFFLMVPMIEQRQYIRYYILAIIATTFHNGAYLLLILYPLTYIPLSKTRIFWLNLIFIPTILIGFMGIDVLGPIGQFLVDNAANENLDERAELYFENENISPIGIFHTLEYFLVMAVFYITCNRLNLKNRKVHTVVWMFLCLLPLFTLFRGSEIITREKDYFVMFYAVIAGYFLRLLPAYRKAIYSFITVLCAFGYYRFVYSFDGGDFLNYTSWLFNPEYSFFIN